MYIYIYQPHRSGRILHKVNFKRSLTGLNSEFSFSKTNCLSKVEEPSLPNYLPIAGTRILRFIPFLKVLMLIEMQSVLSRIWTRVAVSISNNDNHYPTGTSMEYVYLSLQVSIVTYMFAKKYCKHRLKTIIILIIKSYVQQWVSWLSLSILTYHSLVPKCREGCL